jgi:biotin carboxyl carrier protein
MKLTADIDGQTYALELQRAGTRILAAVDGRHYELEARETEAGSLLLIVGGRVYECRADAQPQPGGTREVQVGEELYQVTLIDLKRLRNAPGAGAAAGGRVQIKASMPGKVVRLLVEAGAPVEAGDGLVIVEAMKMQNELKSPKSGKVVEIHTQMGATVNAGEVLITVE